MSASPPSAIPFVKTARLARLLPYYRDVLGFEVVQHVPGVVAFLESGGLELQLWQRNDWQGHAFCVVRLDGLHADIRRLHAAFLRRAPAALMEPKPILQAWDSWEFGLVDCEGNQLVFEQWVEPAVATRWARRG